MNTEPSNQPDNSAIDADTRSEALNDKLRNDASSWMAARSDSNPRESAERSIAVVRAPAAKPTTRARHTKAAPAATQPADVKKKPFGMSYDGMSQADYITYMISRGAR